MTTPLLTACTLQAAIDWTRERPLTHFASDVSQLRRASRPLAQRDQAQLRDWWRDCCGELYAPENDYEKALRAAIALWLQSAEAEDRALALRAVEAALAEITAEPLTTWAARIDDRGAIKPVHHALRNACRLFAYRHLLSGSIEDARKAALLLTRFAEVIPNWPIYVPHYGAAKWSRQVSQDPEAFYRGWDATGLWGTWIYLDTRAAMPLLEAYDLIYSSGVLQDMGSLDSVEAMLRQHVRVQLTFGRAFSNMDGTQMRGILAFANLLREPEWVHVCISWIRDLYQTQFYADGWWHEGTPSYHKQIHHSLKSLFSEWLEGYSDPPGYVRAEDGTRIDDLDLQTAVGGAIERADLALARIQQPNRICQVLNDTVFPQPVWWAPPMKKAESFLFGCMGHAILGSGSDSTNMTQLSLSFGGTHGHEHLDCLNLILFAKGQELLAETRYRPQGITNTTREWHSMTAGHITVVVDGKNQTSRTSPDSDEGGAVRLPQPEDAVPGVPDWPWRWSGHGNMMNDGKLRLFNTDFPQVQVVEADGERAYAGRVTLERYRRTAALVKISESEHYVLDVFRVRGGTTHDYMLHGCLDHPHDAALSLPLTPMTPGDDTLHTYIKRCRQAAGDVPWQVTFSLHDQAASLRSFVLPQAGARVIVGDAPAMRHQGEVPFLAIRREQGESLFAAIHHPFVSAPLVRRVEAIPLAPGSDQAVALRVFLPGAVDTIISTADEHSEVRAADGSFSFRGAFAHWREAPGSEQWVYAVGNQALHTPLGKIVGATGYQGALRGTLRREAGAPHNAFVAAPAALPPDRDLGGHTLMVDMAGTLVQSFGIESLQKHEAGTRILTPDEPGMSITPELTKLHYFPCWGIRGETRFRIAGSALLQHAPGASWTLTATSPVEAAMTPRNAPAPPANR